MQSIAAGQIWQRKYPEHWSDVEGIFNEFTVLRKSEHPKQWVVMSSNEVHLMHEIEVLRLFYLVSNKD